MSENTKKKWRYLSTFCSLIALAILVYILYSFIAYSDDVERLVKNVKVNSIGLGLAALAAVLTGQS